MEENEYPNSETAICKTVLERHSKLYQLFKQAEQVQMRRMSPKQIDLMCSNVNTFLGFFKDK